MSNDKPGQIKMVVWKQHVGENGTDILTWSASEVKIDEEGYGIFVCNDFGVGPGSWRGRRTRYFRQSIIRTFIDREEVAQHNVIDTRQGNSAYHTVIASFLVQSACHHIELDSSLYDIA